jgi:cell division protein FtsB
MRKEILRLDARIQKEDETARGLKISIDSLRHDSRALERLARERLGYAKTGEMVIRFEAPATNSFTR